MDIEYKKGMEFVPGQIIRFTYENWRNEVGVRRAEVIELWHGSTEYHPEPQDLLKARDLDKDGVERDFAVAKMWEP